jgi:F-type H+-transporting ATPase subunit epsilon
MADTLFLEIVTPEKKFYSDDVETLILNTPEGEIGVLSKHMPMVVAVSIGPIRIKKDGKWLDAVLSEGFMEIVDDKVIIFVDTAEWPEEIDANRAKAAAERAQERLQRQLTNLEMVRSQAALQRAMARLKVNNEIK